MSDGEVRISCDKNEGGHGPPSKPYRCIQDLSSLDLGASLTGLSHF